MLTIYRFQVLPREFCWSTGGEDDLTITHVCRMSDGKRVPIRLCNDPNQIMPTRQLKRVLEREMNNG
ncbi:MAG: hypothetical protein M0R06_04785 [Sphaerochaeta sp.]|jgi:hypothetical protein|nr:hypothetical protein [Sphaerochaeta sp.]